MNLEKSNKNLSRYTDALLSLVVCCGKPSVFPAIFYYKDMKNQTAYIYSLNCPLTNKPRYVGKSIHPNQRFLEHISHAKRNNKTHTDKWINALLNNGTQPILIIIKEVPCCEWEFWEKHYILSYKQQEFSLTNHKDGGGGAPPESKIGNTISPETRAKISKSLIGKHPTDETRIKMAQSLAGRGNNRSPVVMMDRITGKDIMTFNTIKEASAYIHRQKNTISACVRGKSPTAGGYKWRYQ
jgi:hypothetical protein